MPTFNNLENLGSVRTKLNTAIEKTEGNSPLTIAAGSAASPGGSFLGDSDTGVFTPAANTFSVATAGTERVRVHPSGGVSIGGTVDPGAGKLSVASVVADSIVASSAATLSGTITLNGQVGVGGANYGTAGQVLTSAGAGNAPVWANSFPSGGIIMWSGSVASIPSGWVLCNGLNGTPNLQDRFVVGAGSSYGVGATGGQNAITSVPAHTHGIGNITIAADGWHAHNGTTATVGDHQHTQDGYNRANSSANNNYTTGTGTSSGNQGNQRTTGSAGAHSHTFTTDGAGSHSHGIYGDTGSAGAASVDTRPPYYALCFIMKA